MAECYDVLIIGGGIAAVSAALTCRNRGKRVAVVTNSVESQSLYKAELITNYPGLEMTGKDFALRLKEQLDGCGAEQILGQVKIAGVVHVAV